MACSTTPSYDLKTPLAGTTAGNTAPLAVTETAAQKILDFASKNASLGKPFRIMVQGGGCSGLQYGFAFDEKKPDDFVVAAGDTEVVVDPMSLSYIKGSTIDYVDSFTGAGFTIKNPNASHSCGCGQSFKA